MNVVKFTCDESVNLYVSYSVYDFLSTHTRICAVTTVYYNDYEKVVLRKHNTHISDMAYYHELYLKDLDDDVNNVTLVLNTFARSIKGSPDMFTELLSQQTEVNSVSAIVDELSVMFNRSLLKIEIRKRDLISLAKIYKEYV